MAQALSLPLRNRLSHPARGNISENTSSGTWLVVALRPRTHSSVESSGLLRDVRAWEAVSTHRLR